MSRSCGKLALTCSHNEEEHEESEAELHDAERGKCIDVAGFPKVENGDRENRRAARIEKDRRADLLQREDEDQRPCADHRRARQRKDDEAQRPEQPSSRGTSGIIELWMKQSHRP